MNIELRFLQKAIKDKNYISFTYEDKLHKKVKPLKLENKDEQYILITENGEFKFEKVSKFKVLK